MANIEVVIIGQNEGRHALKMIGAIPSDWMIHYVADRCTDDTVEMLSRYPVDIVDTTGLGLQGRQTAFCRNLGLSRCGVESDVLFLDGDRYPVAGSLRGAVESCQTEILCLPLEEDFRTEQSFEKQYGEVNSGFYSCGVFFTRCAIEAVQDMQDGELFNSNLQEYWGIEDTSLGDLCYHLRLSASLSDKVRLRGRFERNTLDDIGVLEKRLRFRENLSVKWG